MENHKNIMIVGVGNCGSQVANLAEKKYGHLFETAYINTSDADLSMVTTESPFKFRIGERSDFEGSGKNRTKMKSYLKAHIMDILRNEDFVKTAAGCKYCFIVTSTAGGTGSGAAPLLMQVLDNHLPDTNMILVCVLPQINASLMEQGNTLEFMHELYEIVGERATYMMYDNESASDLPPTQALEKVNINIVEDIMVLSGAKNFATPYESIDEADMESIITTPGRLLVTRLEKAVTTKDLEDSNLGDVVIKAIKQSSHCETDRNKRVLRWGIITYLTDSCNKVYDPTLEKLQEFIGTPVERFNHNAINPGNEDMNFIYLIASGLSPINDRIQRVTNRIDELKAALATDESSKYVLSGDATYEEILRRKNQEKHGEREDINNIFARFMDK